MRQRFGIWLIDHHELIRVKREAEVVFACECAAIPEPRHDFRAARQFSHIVARRRMRFHRQDLAVDAERADPVARAKLQ